MKMNNIHAVRFHEFGGPEVLKFEKLPVPVPTADEIIIRVHCTAVLPVDWAYRQGIMQEFKPIELPFITGSAVSGIIEDVGANVKGYQKGQAVFGSRKRCKRRVYYHYIG